MITLNDSVLNVLKSANNKELMLIDKVIQRAQRRHISINEAMKIEKFQPGVKAIFSDKDGDIHICVVKKAMVSKIRVFDRKSKTELSVYPKELSLYVSKPREDKLPDVQGVIKAKRKYVRKDING